MMPHPGGLPSFIVAEQWVNRLNKCVGGFVEKLFQNEYRRNEEER